MALSTPGELVKVPLLDLQATLMQAASPLAPSLFEVVIIICGVLHLGLFLTLLVWLPRQKNTDPVLRFVGLLVVLVIPVVGPLTIWLSLRRNNTPG